MATLSKSEYDKYLKQIQDIQKQVDALSKLKKAPAGKVLGASTTGLNAAQIGGARGVGFEDEATQTTLGNISQDATEKGVTMSDVGESTSKKGGGAPQTYSAQAANYALRGAGLGGMIDPSAVAGKSLSEGQRFIQAEKAKRQGQITSNTTFAYNPETIAGTKKIVDRVGIGINDITKNAFESKGTQQDKIKATLEASAREIASLFNSQEEYNQAVASNPQLQRTLETYQKLGGDAANIANKITAPVVNTEPQSTGDYLANLTNPQANQEAEKRAQDELIPEREVIQAEIARQNQIPEELKSLYFGTEEQVGILEMKKNQAIEEKRIIEQQEKNEQNNLKAQAKLAIRKLAADQKVQEAQIEENRLAARNYMTGMLAKLGALKTTGNAPLALQTLETKYQIQSQTLGNQYKFAKQEIENQLDDSLNTIETNTDTEILKLEQDLTKDYEDITKEIMKLQQAADKETFNLTNKYATLLRQRTTAYTKELKAEAEKYAKAYAKTASGGLDLNALSDTLEGQYVVGKGVLNPLGGFNKLGLSKAQEAEVQNANLMGTDAVKFFVNLEPAQRRLIAREAVETGKQMTLVKIKEVLQREADAKPKTNTKTTGMTLEERLNAAFK
jgi:hypothetical protein